MSPSHFLPAPLCALFLSLKLRKSKSQAILERRFLIRTYILAFGTRTGATAVVAALLLLLTTAAAPEACAAASDPAISINDVSVVEGTGPDATATFTLTLSAASPQTISV